MHSPRTLSTTSPSPYLDSSRRYKQQRNLQLLPPAPLCRDLFRQTTEPPWPEPNTVLEILPYPSLFIVRNIRPTLGSVNSLERYSGVPFSPPLQVVNATGYRLQALCDALQQWMVVAIVDVVNGAGWVG